VPNKIIDCSIYDEIGNNVSKFDVMCFVTIEANVELKKKSCLDSLHGLSSRLDYFCTWNFFICGITKLWKVDNIDYFLDKDKFNTFIMCDIIFGLHFVIFVFLVLLLYGPLV